jgi:Asp-tRNA(Asn)/Glu-tRNA(Gln) amidotransferase C subunit
VKKKLKVKENKMDRITIEKEAKEILDKFMNALKNVKSSSEDFHVFREEFEREENDNSCIGFKSKLLGNASKKNDDFIIAEKGAWKDERI